MTKKTKDTPGTVTQVPIESSRDVTGPAVGLRVAKTGTRIPLPAGGGTMWLGSDSWCSVVIDDDPTVSGKHCRILQHPAGHYVVYDHGSKNGTYVNGSRVQLSTLAVSAVLRIGDTSFVVYGPNSPEDHPGTPKLDSIVREQIRIHGSERKAAAALDVAKSTLNRRKTPRASSAVPTPVEDKTPTERPPRSTDPRAVPIVSVGDEGDEDA